MAGQLIAMLRVLRLKAALQATVTSAEFVALGAFLDLTRVIMNEDFWTLLFIMCRAPYPQMRILRLADQKIPAMDKLAYFIYQADRLTPQYLSEAEVHIPKLSEGIMDIIDSTDDVASEALDESDDEDDMVYDEVETGDVVDNELEEIEVSSHILNFFYMDA